MTSPRPAARLHGGGAGRGGRLVGPPRAAGGVPATQQGQGWATAPDDGYLYDHLAYHLDAVADHDPVAGEELRSLFADQAWMNVRVPQSRYLYDGYLADLDVVWRRAHAEAHRQIDAGEEPAAIGDCVRYALIGRASTRWRRTMCRSWWRGRWRWGCGRRSGR